MIIGLGYKCRVGKDTIANYLVEEYNFTKIAFADAIKKECKNYTILLDELTRRVKLGYKNYDTNGLYYGFECIEGEEIEYNTFPESMKFFIKEKGENFSLVTDKRWWTKIGVYVYHGIGEKREPLLWQWWGTEFRRKQNESYWIDILYEKLFKLLQMQNGYKELGYFPRLSTSINVVITDVRFLNEVEFIKRFGQLWKIERTQIPTTDRDPNHPSETELDNYNNWDEIILNNGTIKNLEDKIDKIMKRGT